MTKRIAWLNIKPSTFKLINYRELEKRVKNKQFENLFEGIIYKGGVLPRSKSLSSILISKWVAVNAVLRHVMHRK